MSMSKPVAMSISGQLNSSLLLCICFVSSIACFNHCQCHSPTLFVSLFSQGRAVCVKRSFLCSFLTSSFTFSLRVRGCTASPTPPHTHTHTHAHTHTHTHTHAHAHRERPSLLQSCVVPNCGQLPQPQQKIFHPTLGSKIGPFSQQGRETHHFEVCVCTFYKYQYTYT